MNAFCITLIVLSTIIIVYAFFFFVNLIFVYLFLKRLKTHTNALTILLNERFECLKSIINIFNKNSTLNKINSTTLTKYNEIDIVSFKNLTSTECISARQTMSVLNQELYYLFKTNDSFKKNEELLFNFKIIDDIDSQFRILSASYNADVIGYNYWIRFAPYVYIFLFNDVKKRELI